jgi:two-component system, OmpR family, sensor kinase
MELPRVDPQWPRLLSLAVHEFRTPMTVVAGYIRMLLKDRGGALTDQQRRLLEEAEKSCARLSALLSELSDLGALEKGAATFNRSDVDLRAVLREAIGTLPEIPEREVPVDLATEAGPATVTGDPVRLRTALAAVLHALRRELPLSSRLIVRESTRRTGDRVASWIAMGDEGQIGPLQSATAESLASFDEWRGGCGMSLPVARRVLEAHGGAVWSPQGEKAAAVVMMPLAR